MVTLHFSQLDYYKTTYFSQYSKRQHNLFMFLECSLKLHTKLTQKITHSKYTLIVYIFKI